MGEDDVGGVNFVHESPSLLLDAESGQGGETAELLVSATVMEELAGKRAENLLDTLQDFRLFVGEEKRLAGI